MLKTLDSISSIAGIEANRSTRPFRLGLALIAGEPVKRRSADCVVEIFEAME